ncbi:hypothetical protein [Chryseobacterium sp. YIM B08800]|uniref:hypothetical protein n=1 Tax=Chryseobacterium sp. YIM B08800 TaxID=2984136 RepID=UPI00223EC39B|nr:hypothetical protein [Chryseobacterium sp. YIM B08800]
MELKQINKVIILLNLIISITIMSQMKISDIENKKISIDLNKEKGNVIEIFGNRDYKVYYILNKKRFDFDKKIKNVDLANIIFYSKKYNKGILTVLKQGIEHNKDSIYKITLSTGSFDNNMFIPSMIIVDKNFNYEYLMKYYYMPLPPPDSDKYTAGFSIQEFKNYCNTKNIDLKNSIIYEDINDILSNISKISVDKTGDKCNPIIYDIDFRDFFPKKITK